MKTLQKFINHLVDGADLPPGLTEFMSSFQAQDFVVKLVELDGVLSSHVFNSLFSKEETPSPPKEEAYELTTYQKSAETKILAWLEEDPLEHPFFLVKGFAGSGKSWFSGHLNRLFKTLPSPPSTIFSAAPTHKAAAVSQAFLGTDVSTLASLLNVRVSDEDEELSFTLPETLPVFPPNSLLRIDESSMVNHQYTEFLKVIAKTFHLRILFFGDFAQLPPVKESRSPVRDIVDVEDEAHQETLFDVKRYAGVIQEFATAVRKAVFSKKAREDFHDILRDLRSCAELEVFYSMEGALTKYLGEFESNTCRSIAWRNDAVDSHAAFVRQKLNFTEDYSVGETYALRRATRTTIGAEVGYAEAEVTIVSRDLDKDYMYVDHRIPSVRLQVTGAFDAAIRVVAPDCEVFLVEALTKMARKARNTKNRWDRSARWKEFWALKNSFAVLVPSHSLTAHRAQGSQYPHVIVDVRDILSMPRRKTAFSCLYVAVTRATKKLTLVL